MSVFFILISVSVLVGAGFLSAFIWSVRSDQFEDKEGSSMRMLYDNDTKQS